MLIFASYITGYCGEEQNEVLDLPEDMTEEEVNNLVWLNAVDWAASFGHEICDCGDPDCEMEHDDNTTIEGYWVPYNPELHDGLV